MMSYYLFPLRILNKLFVAVFIATYRYKRDSEFLFVHQLKNRKTCPSSVALLFILVFASFPVSSQEYWCAKWWPTDGWDKFPYGSHIHSEQEAIETSQVGMDRGYGEGVYNCTHTRFYSTVKDYDYKLGDLQTYGCEIHDTIPSDKIYQVICTRDDNQENKPRQKNMWVVFGTGKAPSA